MSAKNGFLVYFLINYFLVFTDVLIFSNIDLAGGVKSYRVSQKKPLPYNAPPCKSCQNGHSTEKQTKMAKNRIISA